LTAHCRCEEEDYDKRIIAYLPTLRYLDWVRVTEETRSESNALFVDDLEKVRLIEDIASAKVNTTVVAEAKRDKFINGLMPNVCRPVTCFNHIEPQKLNVA
jgi:hypothetical protein